MFSKPSPDAIQRQRTLLERVEQTADPCFDADTIESIKNFVRTHIRALEAAQALLTEPPQTPPK
jgi:hypothetical protein